MQTADNAELTCASEITVPEAHARRPACCAPGAAPSGFMQSAFDQSMVSIASYQASSCGSSNSLTTSTTTVQNLQKILQPGRCVLCAHLMRRWD